MLLKIAAARPKERPSGFIGNFSVNFLHSNALMPTKAATIVKVRGGSLRYNVADFQFEPMLKSPKLSLTFVAK